MNCGTAHTLWKIFLTRTRFWRYALKTKGGLGNRRNLKANSEEGKIIISQDSVKSVLADDENFPKGVTKNIPSWYNTPVGGKKKPVDPGEAVSGPHIRKGAGIMSVTEVICLLNLIATVALVIVTAMKK